MRSSRVVRAVGCQCRSRNSPGRLGYDPSILQHSGIWGAADEAVLNTVHRKKSNKLPCFILQGVGVMTLIHRIPYNRKSARNSSRTICEMSCKHKRIPIGPVTSLENAPRSILFKFISWQVRLINDRWARGYSTVLLRQIGREKKDLKIPFKTTTLESFFKKCLERHTRLQVLCPSMRLSIARIVMMFATCDFGLGLNLKKN